jgi:hypothetical protein
MYHLQLTSKSYELSSKYIEFLLIGVQVCETSPSKSPFLKF